MVAKAEHLAKGANPRFVVTSLDLEEHPAKELYEETYTKSGKFCAPVPRIVSIGQDRLGVGITPGA